MIGRGDGKGSRVSDHRLLSLYSPGCEGLCPDSASPCLPLFSPLSFVILSLHPQPCGVHLWELTSAFPLQPPSQHPLWLNAFLMWQNTFLKAQQVFGLEKVRLVLITPLCSVCPQPVEAGRPSSATGGLRPQGVLTCDLRSLAADSSHFNP